MKNREKVAKLDKESENRFTLFPRRETKNAEPKGITTNNGIMYILVCPVYPFNL
ncbi:unnamed protein product, partial [marine sediment metagenome]